MVLLNLLVKTSTFRFIHNFLQDKENESDVEMLTEPHATSTSFETATAETLLMPGPSRCLQFSATPTASTPKTSTVSSRNKNISLQKKKN